MINALKTLFSIESGTEPGAETVSPKSKPTTLEAVNAKIAAFKAEIESRAEEDRQLTKMLAEETAKQERLRQAGDDLKNVYQDLTRARTAAEQKKADVTAAAAVTRQKDRELFKLLQELESPPVSSAPPAPPTPPRRPEPAPAVATPVTPEVAPPTPIGSPEAEPYLELSPFND